MISPLRIRSVALILGGALLVGCGSSETTITAPPTATPRRGTPTITPTRGVGTAPPVTPTPDAPETPTDTPRTPGTRTATPPGQRTRTHTASPPPPTTRTRTVTGGPVGPQTLYVRTSGSDDNPGDSPDQALQTLGRAAEMMGPATTVFVGPGEHRGRVAIGGVAGTAEEPVLLLADPSGRETGDDPGPVILDADGTTAALVITRSTFLTIDGFMIRGAVPQTEPEPLTATAIGVRTGSHNTTIKNCEIVNDGSSDGIRIDGANDVLVFNNLLFQNDRGILLTGDAQGTRIINNTLATHQRTAIAIAQRGGIAPADTTVRNNVIQGNENNLAITVDQGPPSSLTGYEGNFNLAFEPGVEDQGTIYRPERIRGENDVNADALFVNVEAGDLHLDPSSPAIDAGTDDIDSGLVSELRGRSAVADGAPDDGPIDMGYHYP